MRNPRLIEALEPRQLLSGGGVFVTDQDVGAPAQSGGLSYAGGTYTLTAGGADIGGTSDQFHFADNPFAGDGSVVARVGSIANTDGQAKAGVMFRSGLGASAAFAGMFVTPASGITFITRAADGATAAATITPGFTAPRFLRLTRAGTQVTAFYSANGSTWTQLGASQGIALGQSTLAGIAATSRNILTTTTATFTAVGLVPPGWSDADVGAPATFGSAAYDSASNRFVVHGGGADVGGTSDQFNLVSRPFTGDGSVIAFVDSIAAPDPGAKAGVLIRDDATGGAMFASVMRTAGGSVVFQWRSAAGATAGSTSVSVGNAPVWVKLTQKAGSFTASYSSGGTSWAQIGASQPIVMTSATTLAGLAVTSHDNSSIAVANFRGVSIVRDGWRDLDLGSPAFVGSADYDAPSDTVTLVGGGGAGIGGTSDAFHFAARNMTGDGGVVAYVDGMTNPDPSALAGVMIRAADSATAAFAGLFVTPQNGLVFEWRTTDGAAAQQQILASIAAPVSLRLTRTGNTFNAYYSTNGSSWTVVGTGQPIAMPALVSAGLAVSSHNDAAVCTATFSGVAAGSNLPPGAGVYSAADELFLNDLEQRSVLFYFNETNAGTGLVPDSSNANGGSPSAFSSIAALGFGLTALTIGDRRGWLTHAAAYQRAATTINFLFSTAAQVNGFFYHFLNPATGARFGTSEVSSVDTAELMSGVLNVAQYWHGTALETTALGVFNRVNWPWMQRTNGQFYGAWTPEQGFTGGYGDFSEAALLYMLALGSPMHPAARSSWTSWSRSPVVSYAGMTYVTADDAALFTVQYPMAWFDLRGLTDERGLNYYQNAITATLAQRQWMTDLKTTYGAWGPNVWGLTPSDSAHGYAVWGGPPASGPIDGTVVPTGPGGSLAFTPRQSLDALRFMQQTYASRVYQKYGFVDAFNPQSMWTSALVLGIDAGMMLLAAENARSSFVWDTFGQSAVARQSRALAFPSTTPSLLAAASRKVRPDSIAVDVNVDPTGGTLAVEGRLNGPTRLVLTFETNVVAGPGFGVTLSSGSVSGTTVSGSTLTIDLSGVADAQTLVVHVLDLRHFATAASGNYTFSLGVLAGDANGDAKVDLTDFTILASNFNKAGGATLADGDFNNDGNIDLTDFTVLASQFNKSIGAAATSSSAMADIRSRPLPAPQPRIVDRDEKTGTSLVTLLESDTL